KDQQKLALLARGEPPIKEQHMQELLYQVSDKLTFSATIDGHVAEAGVIMIAVGTPAFDNGEANIQHVEEAAEQAATDMVAGRTYIMVVKSTVPIGTNRRVAHVVERTLARRGVV